MLIVKETFINKRMENMIEKTLKENGYIKKSGVWYCPCCGEKLEILDITDFAGDSLIRSY